MAANPSAATRNLHYEQFSFTKRPGSTGTPAGPSPRLQTAGRSDPSSLTVVSKPFREEASIQAGKDAGAPRALPPQGCVAKKERGIHAASVAEVRGFLE